MPGKDTENRCGPGERTKASAKVCRIRAIRRGVDKKLESLDRVSHRWSGDGLAVVEGGSPMLQRVGEVRKLDGGVLLEVV